MLELLLVLWRLLLALWRRFAPANGPAKALRAHQASAHRQQRPAMLHAPSSAADASSPSLLDLPADVLERLATCPALDAPARLALFRTCHALARLAFVHAPERTVTRHGEDDDQEDVQAGAYAALGQLLDRWAPEDLHFELLDCAPSKPPPLSVRRHVTRLSLILRDTPAPPDWDWVGWLGGGTWPRLQHLTWDSGGDEPAPGRKLPRPIPTLRKLTLAQSDYMETRYEVLEPLLRLASGPHMEELEWNSFHESGCSDGLEVALRRLRRLTRVRTNSLRPVGDVMRLLEHPTVRHVELSDGLSWDWPDLSGWRCAWRTFAVGTCDLRLIASKFPGAKVSECVVVGGRFMHYGDELDSYREGLELLERLQAQGKLTVLRQDPRLGNQEWGLSRSQGLGLVVAPEQFLPRVARLVAHAGRGVSCLHLGPTTRLSVELLRQLDATLEGGGVHTLCLQMSTEPPAGVLAALPRAITELRLDMWSPGMLTTLLREGAPVTRPLRILGGGRARFTAELAAELRQLARERHPGVELLI